VVYWLPVRWQLLKADLYYFDKLGDQVEHIVVGAAVFFDLAKPLIKLFEFMLEAMISQRLSRNGNQVEDVAVLADEFSGRFHRYPRILIFGICDTGVGGQCSSSSQSISIPLI